MARLCNCASAATDSNQPTTQNTDRRTSPMTLPRMSGAPSRDPLDLPGEVKLPNCDSATLVVFRVTVTVDRLRSWSSVEEDIEEGRRLALSTRIRRGYDRREAWQNSYRARTPRPVAANARRSQRKPLSVRLLAPNAPFELAPPINHGCMHRICTWIIVWTANGICISWICIGYVLVRDLANN